MSKFKNSLDQFADKFMPDGVSVSELKMERIWIIIMFVAAIFASLFTFVNSFVIVGPAAQLCASVTVMAPLYIWLFKQGRRTASKMLLHLHVILVLFVITLLYTEDGYAWTFLVPVVMSSLVIFTPKQRKYTFILLFTSFIFLPLYMGIRTHFTPLEFNEESMTTFKILNLTGCLLFCAIIISALGRMNESTLRQLRVQMDENIKQNKIMLGSIRTRDKLLSMMSHDVRGDIGKTIGVVDVIEQMDLSKEDQATLLHNLKLDAVKTLETLDNMLQWTRTQQDELSTKPERYEVDRLMSRQLSNHDYALHAKRQLVHLNIPEKLVLLVDHNMIDSVFRNLIGNAIKFTPIEGVISISAERKNSVVEFSIQDSGVGMTPEQIDNISKGVQFTTRGTNREKGRGFGMVLVNEFLSKHKSTLHINSTPGKGTRFSFALPIETDSSL